MNKVISMNEFRKMKNRKELLKKKRVAIIVAASVLIAGTFSYRYEIIQDKYNEFKIVNDINLK
ncbi:MAG: hypothetical protein ACRCW0_08875, partial [Clostridium sp.]|uniref:Uncharacterized protein n=1 Tax=Romboutsia lituseburensis DSM 797 TaxID=1121325 RepID=A0A1G9SN53_9FIRM|nr:hypothetical protein [Romboutsia lituseburensis]CEH32980.1 Hypothetical protein RLITU_0370 [Romboutsia lituseburensis]SDM36888.1 hypothetical protein SAMN04515677_11032 [Romboutsia lituseburensis DSM 797]